MVTKQVVTTKERLLAKAEKPTEDAMKLHPFYRGKIEVVPKCCIRDFDDFAIWYTPGVAHPCLAIKDKPELVYDMTNKGNMVAVVTDGSRVLGLGNIGPEAGMPVMEGKALLYKYLGGVDAFPVCLDTQDPEQIIQTVKLIQPCFGGINLEDISHPKCFYILDRLRAEARIPVWHDDQQGTATVTLAAFINALKVVGKSMSDITIAMIGAGAANVATGRLLFAAGVQPEHTVFVDSKGILHRGRKDIEQQKEKYPDKWRLCTTTNKDQRIGNIAEAMEGMDAVIALSVSNPDTIKKEWVSTMAKDPIVFACANPLPEIWPWDAKEAGAKIVATGRSDFPNQVNNSMGFPAIFRGALDVAATTITDEMCIAAADELAKHAEVRGLSEEYITPTMDEPEAFFREAATVGMKAQEQGVARRKLAYDELYQQAKVTITRAREMVGSLMKEGYIKAVA
jgi:malate dehydrogenase (oxaloacetate-decarboxylating)